jgi:hypothetical protein
MISLNSLLLKRETFRNRKAIEDALALSSQKRSTPRWPTLTHASHCLEIEWRTGRSPVGPRFRIGGARVVFAEQTIADTDAAWHRGVTAAIVAIAAVALGIWLQESYSKVVTVPWLHHILHRLYIWLAKSSYLRTALIHRQWKVARLDSRQAEDC